MKIDEIKHVPIDDLEDARDNPVNPNINSNQNWFQKKCELWRQNIK